MSNIYTAHSTLISQLDDQPIDTGLTDRNMADRSINVTDAQFNLIFVRYICNLDPSRKLFLSNL